MPRLRRLAVVRDGLFYRLKLSERLLKSGQWMMSARDLS